MKSKYKKILLLYLISLCLIIVGTFSRYSYIINFLSLTILPVLIYEKGFKTKLEIDFRCRKTKFTLFILLSTLSIYILALFILKGTTFNSPQDIGKFILFQIFYVVIPEEVFFRGILLGNIKKENNLIISRENLLVSILFAITHVLTFKNPMMLKVILPSLIFGFLFEKTDSLCSPILAHLAYNIAYSFFPLF